MRALGAAVALLFAVAGCAGDQANDTEDEPRFDPRPGIVDTPLEEQN